MSLKTKHPAVIELADDWRTCADALAGARAIKDAGERYLPPTANMRFDGYPTANTPGMEAYLAYKARAKWPGFFSDAVRRGIGMLHQKPPVINLPAGMEYLRERATPRGESLEQLLRRINRQQLAFGRLGVLADMPVNAERGREFYLALYQGDRITNWHEGGTEPDEPRELQLVVLDETGMEMNPRTLQWERLERYRVLYVNEEGQYVSGEHDHNGLDFTPDAYVPPLYRGTPLLGQLPFVIINACDLVPEPDEPPLMELANLCLSLYRSDADWRQNLFMNTQDTFVTVGDRKGEQDGGEDVRVGAGAHVAMEEGGEAFYVGVNSQGLPELRKAIEMDRDEAQGRAGELIDAGEAESGRALNIRVAGKAFTLADVAHTGAAGLQAVLRKVAEWGDMDPNEVVIEPNTDFTNEVASGADMKAWQEFRMLGGPLSARSIHERLRRLGITDKDYEQELEELADEASEALGAGE